MKHDQIWYWERRTASASALTDAEKNEVKVDYEEITGRNWTEDFSVTCPNCFRDAITIILAKMKQNNNQDAGGYVLKSGVVFKYKGKTITHQNITAAAAEWFIKQDLNNRDKFWELAKDYDSYDPNYKENE